MRGICAWCGRALGVKEPSANPQAETPPADMSADTQGTRGISEDTQVTPTICTGCAGALASYRRPVLVVSRDWVRMYDDLVEMLKGRPDIQVVVDRRASGGTQNEATGWNGKDRRRKDDPFTLK